MRSYWRLHKGEIYGLGLDVMRNVSDQLSLPFQYVEQPWKRALLSLQQGKVDIIIGIYWTKERARKYYYSSPFLQNEARVFVLKGKEFKFEILSDLIGKAGDIPLGGSFGEEFDQFAKQHLSLHQVGKKSEHVARLQKGRSQFFISDYFDTTATLKTMKLSDSIIPLTKPVSTTQVYFAISRNSPCSNRAAEVFNAVEWLRNDGTLEQLRQKYLNLNAP